MPIVGSLERVASFPGLLERAADPERQFQALRWDSAIAVIDLRRLAVSATFEDARGTIALAPGGQHIAVRRDGYLAIRAPRETVAEVTTATTPSTDEHLGFTRDGRYVWLATHGDTGRPCMMLFDRTLALVDRFDDLRSYSPYGAQPWESLYSWDGAHLATQVQADLVLAYCNVGDACAGLFAFRFRRGRIVVDQERISNAIYGRVDASTLFHLELTSPRRLLVMDRDGHVRNLAWPVSAGRRQPRVDPAADLVSNDGIVLPFGKRERLVVPGLMTTTRHVLVCVEPEQSLGTRALIVLDPASLRVRGLIRPPPRAGTIQSIGRDLLASVQHRVTLWRIAR